MPDINVYDAAAWSAPTPLSEHRSAQNGAPQKFPDFTRGKVERNGFHRLRRSDLSARINPELAIGALMIESAQV